MRSSKQRGLKFTRIFERKMWLLGRWIELCFFFYYTSSSSLSYYMMVLMRNGWQPCCTIQRSALWMSSCIYSIFAVWWLLACVCPSIHVRRYTIIMNCVVMLVSQQSWCTICRAELFAKFSFDISDRFYRFSEYWNLNFFPCDTFRIYYINICI